MMKDTGEQKKKLTLEDILLTKKDVMNLASMAEFGLKDLCLSYEAKNSLGNGMEQEMGVLAHQNQLTKGFDGNLVLSWILKKRGQTRSMMDLPKNEHTSEIR